MRAEKSLRGVKVICRALPYSPTIIMARLLKRIIRVVRLVHASKTTSLHSKLRIEFSRFLTPHRLAFVDWIGDETVRLSRRVTGAFIRTLWSFQVSWAGEEVQKGIKFSSNSWMSDVFSCGIFKSFAEKKCKLFSFYKIWYCYFISWNNHFLRCWC